MDLKKRIENLIEEGEKHTFSSNSYRSQNGVFSRPGKEFLSWIAEVEDLILTNHGDKSSPWNVFQQFERRQLDGYYGDTFEHQKSIIIASLMSCLRIPPKQFDSPRGEESDLKNIFDNFHLVVKQLRKRYNNRPTIDINDEYDVQDLLHGLLRIYYDDIRSEEWAPSYAGGSSRMDFLLKKSKVVIEVKKTRQGLTDKELGKQLIEDKAKYRAHPDCKKLICFVYDPEGRILNPRGIESDLNDHDSEFEISIVIKP